MSKETFAFHTRYVNESKAILRSLGVYHDNSNALAVFCANPHCQDHVPGEELSRVTVCMSSYGAGPTPGYVFLKDYAENEGTVEALHEAGIIAQPERWLDAGHAKQGVAEAKLLIEIGDL